MSNSALEFARDALPLAGVIVGALIGAWLNSLGETRRWRREWIMELSKQHQDFLAEVAIVIDRQYVVLGKCHDAVLGKRPVVPRSDIREADAEWGRVLSMSLLRAQPPVQLAMSAFDKARADCVDAINSRQPAAMAATYATVHEKRAEVIAAANQTLEAMGPHISRHVLPLRVRAWRRLTRRSPNYL